MRKINFISCLLCLLLFFGVTSQVKAAYPAGSPVAINGKLKVSGTQLVNECGYPVQLRGMSTHGPQWFGNCICNEALQTLVDDWGISLFRIAMYVQEGGYVEKKEYWRGWIDDLVDQCESLGIYVLIDWHVLNPGNPNANLDDSKEFWQYMSNKHGQKKHVLYEICNEPNGTDWSTVKNYADQIVPIIRNNNDETVIIIGTPTWSQDVDIASQNKVDATNIMYTLHFYAGSHGDELRNKAKTAMSNGAAIFVTEWGTCDASGNGNYSPDATRTWVNWMNENKISWANWSYSDKGETASALQSGSCDGKQWNNTTESGKLVKDLITANPFAYTTCNGVDTGGSSDSGNTGGNTEEKKDTTTTPVVTPNNPSTEDTTKKESEPVITEPVTYPDLDNSIAENKIYRIVNKHSGKVIALSGSTAEKATISQTTLSNNDKSQQFTLVTANGQYFIKSVESGMVLSNQYNPNDQAEVVQQNESSYDNPSEKWAITLVEGQWFRIANKTCSDATALGVENASSNDGAAVKQYTWTNADNQLWGFEFVAPTGIKSLDGESIALYPTLVRNNFYINSSTDYNTVNIFSIIGVKVRSFAQQSEYNISDLPKGNYIVTIGQDQNVIKRIKIIKE